MQRILVLENHCYELEEHCFDVVPNADPDPWI